MPPDIEPMEDYEDVKKFFKQFNNFFSMSYQQNLKLSIQECTETHYDALKLYEANFMTSFRLLKKGFKELPNEQLTFARKKHAFGLKLIEQVFLVDDTEIQNFFNEIICNVYEKWLRNHISSATSAFKKILEKEDLLSFSIDLKGALLYRGRINSYPLSKWDMFHIPFNKRYMIGNQRYSLTGQPLLYLGDSAMCVAQEIGSEKYSELNISSFFVTNSLKVYDLNPRLLEQFIAGETEVSGTLLSLSMKDIFEKRNIKKEIYHYILHALCSFPRRNVYKDSKFCEEYVLPQLLAQIIRSQKFDGIAYLATWPYKDNEFGINYALFTNYNKTHVYDRNLYNKFEISSPLTAAQKHVDSTLSLDTYTILVKDIFDYINWLFRTPDFIAKKSQKENSKLLSDIKLIGIVLTNAKKLNDIVSIENSESENITWKLHYYLLYLKLLEIKSSVYMYHLPGGDIPNV